MIFDDFTIELNEIACKMGYEGLTMDTSTALSWITDHWELDPNYKKLVTQDIMDKMLVLKADKTTTYTKDEVDALVSGGGSLPVPPQTSGIFAVNKDSQYKKITPANIGLTSAGTNNTYMLSTNLDGSKLFKSSWIVEDNSLYAKNGYVDVKNDSQVTMRTGNLWEGLGMGVSMVGGTPSYYMTSLIFGNDGLYYQDGKDPSANKYRILTERDSLVPGGVTEQQVLKMIEDETGPHLDNKADKATTYSKNEVYTKAQTDAAIAASGGGGGGSILPKEYKIDLRTPVPLLHSIPYNSYLSFTDWGVGTVKGFKVSDVSNTVSPKKSAITYPYGMTNKKDGIIRVITNHGTTYVKRHPGTNTTRGMVPNSATSTFYLDLYVKRGTSFQFAQTICEKTVDLPVDENDVPDIGYLTVQNKVVVDLNFKIPKDLPTTVEEDGLVSVALKIRTTQNCTEVIYNHTQKPYSQDFGCSVVEGDKYMSLEFGDLITTWEEVSPDVVSAGDGKKLLCSDVYLRHTKDKTPHMSIKEELESKVHVDSVYNKDEIDSMLGNLSKPPQEDGLFGIDQTGDYHKINFDSINGGSLGHNKGSILFGSTDTGEFHSSSWSNIFGSIQSDDSFARIQIKNQDGGLTFFGNSWDRLGTGIGTRDIMGRHNSLLFKNNELVHYVGGKDGHEFKVMTDEKTYTKEEVDALIDSLSQGSGGGDSGFTSQDLSGYFEDNVYVRNIEAYIDSYSKGNYILSDLELSGTGNVQLGSVGYEVIFSIPHIPNVDIEPSNLCNISGHLYDNEDKMCCKLSNIEFSRLRYEEDGHSTLYSIIDYMFAPISTEKEYKIVFTLNFKRKK
ncbi:MAG: hypothetical protein ACRDDH_09310 [Cetobacterium sp.]|uniref:hypothetical protein n=1 Tax=Cetobacterium sp. TaxID=2071632 RepID=UPI003EE65B8B